MEIIGHQKIVEELRQRIGSKNFAQAYIFSGPQNVGKHFVADIFARGVVVGKDFTLLSDGEISQADPDILKLCPEKKEEKGVIKEKEITVDQVKEKQLMLATFPYLGKAKVLIIDDSDRMNIRAQNAMLKTIEEPNSTAVIILVTSRLEKILPTIRSRCQIINFNLVGVETMEKYFFSQKASSDRKAIDFSMGRPGTMLEMMDDPQKIAWYQDSKDRLRRTLGGSDNEKLKIAEEFSKNVPEAIRNLNFWLWLLQQACAVEDILRCEKIENAMGKMKNTNANPRLLLENVFLSL